ncbi:TFIIB-type zinc ribbon-containing protein [Photobacterium sp. J15]|uniref:TFIIB-type zinc ribbon-containing protein n=1 Tax=Photobacterium sp. J15 TaxID=265901 RepID=UPI0007E4BD0A|nr:zf-TFIIB domain-containing protein [Photobacterium sp. J15]
MKCTGCKVGALAPSFIDGLFRAHTCTHCGGNWILIEDYVSWKENNPEYVFSDDIACEAVDTETALLCPQSGKIMRKFRITSDTTHRLDYSAAVGGVWLDKGEWELMKKDGLAGSLNAVLTAQWQKNIRMNNAKDNFAELYKEKFGQESYNKVREVREWLNAQPNKADLRAYLLAEDPYSAER